MKILKKKGGVVEKRGEEETKSMPHAPVHWMRMKLPDNFHIREHLWPCLFHIMI
jgi:hypothetical protein